MTSEHNEKIFRRWVQEVWNEKRESAIEEMFAQDGLATCPKNLPNSPIRGIEDFKSFFRGRHQAVHHFKMTIEDLVCEADKVTALCRIVGIKQYGNTDDCGKEIEISGLYIVKIIAGKIIEAWHGFDFDNSYRRIDELMRQS